MGMYTQFHFGSQLKSDTPKEVIDILEFMAGITDEEPSIIPEHEFFKCDRWKVLFRMSSAYFDYQTHCEFSEGCLSVTSNLKNYDNEIDKFVCWVSPYLRKYEGDFLGYSRYEEFEQPELIFYSLRLNTPSHE